MQEQHGRHFARLPEVIHDQNIPIQRASYPPQPPQAFRPLPPPIGPAPYHLALAEVLPPAWIEQIQAAGRLVFHMVGDTGGVKSPESQMLVMKHMEMDFATPDVGSHPAFFYNLGDIVYYYGEDRSYYGQFYEPNMQYPAPIFAIPGNHDGSVYNETDSTLAAFTRHFCAREPYITKEAGDAFRDAMTQPNYYWTLDAPFATIIGLYTNVPEGGILDEAQLAWLESELASAPTDKALLLAMHQPAYSADKFHGGSPSLSLVLDQAIERAGRIPDLVLAGHVHNYQRFTRNWHNHEVPYLVAGCGGFWELYPLYKIGEAPLITPFPIAGTDITLEHYCGNRHGYLRFEASVHTLKGEFLTVPRPHEAWKAPSVVKDSFTLDLQEHRLLR